MNNISNDISTLKGIGKKRNQYFYDLGIHTYLDLLEFYPKNYSVYEVINLSLLKQNMKLTCSGFVSSVVITKKFKQNGNITTFSINSFNKIIKVVVFGQPFLYTVLKIGMKINIYGYYDYLKQEIICNKIFYEEFDYKIDVNYGVKNLTSSIISNVVKICLESINKEDIIENIPVKLIERYKLISKYKLFNYVHFPQNRKSLYDASRRLKYEEFFLYALKLEILKYHKSETYKDNIKIDYDLIVDFIGKLPFKLTKDQEIAVADTLKDLESNKLLNRLIQGDVGSGKSIVALICSLAVVNSKKQVVIMAPTELLAKQHYVYFKEYLKKFDFNIAFISGKIKVSEKKEVIMGLINHKIDIVIGTHALIESNVQFADLGLAIIDEQHRFGVFERMSLVQKHSKVNALYLTATPIPRTLGLTNFGELDISSIKTLPSGKKKIETKVVNINQLDDLFEKIKEILTLNQQIYIVVPLVNESEHYDYYDIDKARDLIKQNVVEAKIGVLHGRLKSEEKQEVMNNFLNQKHNVLVATTVIEVGINVKNATMIVIFNAYKYGLSQLHQLRGRVGRNELESFCYLVSDDKNYERLSIIEKFHDGFSLAEEDFKLRGPGDFLGVKQSGFLEFNVANMKKDYTIYEIAINDAKEIMQDYVNNKIKHEIVRKLMNKFKNGKILN